MNDISTSHSLPSDTDQEDLSALYEMLICMNKNSHPQFYTPRQILENLIVECEKVITEGVDVSVVFLSIHPVGIEKQVDHLNDIYNRKKDFMKLRDSFQKYEKILEQSVRDPQYRKMLQEKLEKQLFSPLNFWESVIDTSVRMMGGLFGFYK